MKPLPSDNDCPALTSREIAQGKKLGQDVSRSGKPEQESKRIGKDSDHVHARKYEQSNWYSPLGVYRKRAEIEALGLPSFYHWRFITLTIDRTRFSSPLEAYLVCRDDLRRFMFRCRKRNLWRKDTPWCWKLEFQKEDGWPHWHLLVGRTQKFSEEQLAEIRDEWKHGRTSVEMVRNDDFLYSFKYAFKPVLQDNEGQSFEDDYCLPAWFMDYMGVTVVSVKLPDGSAVKAQKPVTFQKVRFWQTSKGFYTGTRREPVVSGAEQETWSVPVTVRQMVESAACKVHIISRKGSGKYLSSAVAVLSITAAQFWALAGWHAAGGNGAFLGVFSAVIPTHIVNHNTKNKWQLQQHLEQNRLTLRRAVILQREGQTLLKC